MPAGAQADAPAAVLRPPAREAPDPAARPMARSGEVPALVLELRSGGSPDAQADLPKLAGPSDPVAVSGPGADPLPPVARRAPLLESEPPAPKLEGPFGLVRAEEMMTDPPPVAVVVGGWNGADPPARPAMEPLRASGPAPGRPRLRPLPPQDPLPLPPPEPDGPPAYSPDAQPRILPEGPGYSPFAVSRAILPASRSADLVERAAQRRAAMVRGQVCGDPAIQGEVVASIRGSGGCGVEEPVLVRSVDGVRLSTPAMMDCTTAEALLDWTRSGVRPAVGTQGGGLVELEVMGGYTCRPRNNQAGARLSEHGKGRAIDIGAAVLADGSRLSVLRHWPDPALRQMRDSACGIFSTVLGPGADAYHDDHLHLDTARRSGTYCR